jgi:hypothetical protein
MKMPILTATLKTKCSGVIIDAVIKSSGNELTNDSDSMDGLFRWRGNYSRRYG